MKHEFSVERTARQRRIESADNRGTRLKRGTLRVPRPGVHEGKRRGIQYAQVQERHERLYKAGGINEKGA